MWAYRVPSPPLPVKNCSSGAILHRERLKNGEIVTVKEVKEDGSLSLKDGRAIPSHSRQFTHGYRTNPDAPNRPGEPRCRRPDNFAREGCSLLGQKQTGLNLDQLIELVPSAGR